MPTPEKPAYFALRIEIHEDATELVQAVLDDTGLLGLEIRDRSLKLPAGTPPLPEGKVQFVAYYEGREEAAAALRGLLAELPQATADLDPVQIEDWAETWKKHVKPVRVGRIWVGPSWERQNAGDASIQIEIDPGMAFGTGDHPTTSMCLAAMDELLSARRGLSVLDVGTGSGVLAIAARKLGAGRVAGNDVDPLAVQIAIENAARNGAPGLELVDLPIERIKGTFDLVVANLFTNVLCQLAPRIVAHAAPDGGVILLTGILAPQAPEVHQAFEREGAAFIGKRAVGEWVLLQFERRE